MLKYYAILIVIFTNGYILMSQDHITPFERDTNYSASYHECVDYYKGLAKDFSLLTIAEAGPSDAGLPIYEIVIQSQDVSQVEDKLVLFINNAIHPGEPCGVDASMIFARDLCTKKEFIKLLEKVIVVIIPYYNVGGGLKRGSFSRANQEGPKEYGFRGNAKNLDLNRDFVKCDSKNAKTFNRLYNKWTPEVFIDNHTSNGADYQYVMTLIATQKDKLGPSMSKQLSESMLPKLYSDMSLTPYEMTPYVYAKHTPDHGIIGFLDSPRYSTGYAALHHSIGFMPETHMLKPFYDRVWSTYHFMSTTISYCYQNKEQLIQAYEVDVNYYANQKTIPIDWKISEEDVEEISFKGYQAGTKKSNISGQDRLYYDRTKPFEKLIPFRNKYIPTKEVSKPKLYIIPQAYDKVIDRLLLNGVKINRLNKDTIIEVEYYYIENYKTVQKPYEGHYLHYDIELSKRTMKENWQKGDYVIETGQETDRYIVETLEPEAPDSFFAWNFFDGILGQKEYFSDYVFEDLAEKILQNDPELKNKFELKKKQDQDFSNDAKAQLTYIYKQSPYYENTNSRYPIGRVF